MDRIVENVPALWRDKITQPSEADNKYTRGHVLINGAGITCTGATKLAANASARAGSGIVTVACDRESLPIYAASFMSVMAKPIKAKEEFFKYIDERKVRSVLVGPGNGLTEELREKTLALLDLKIPLVIDADAMSVFKDNPQELFSKLHINCVLTPHEGEFARLFPDIMSLDISKAEKASKAAEISGSVIVFKGGSTYIANPEGLVVVNEHAPTSLSTAGTGDVLAGIIAGLMAQSISGFDSACAGVYIHSKAARPFGAGMMVEDMLGEIGGILDGF